MHEDSTRRMDVPPPGRPPGGSIGRPPQDPPPGSGMSPGLKATVVLLVAAVLGLGLALVLVASGDDREDDPPLSTVPGATVPTTAPPTSATTQPETTTTIAPEATTVPSEAPPETTTSPQTTTSTVPQTQGGGLTAP